MYPVGIYVADQLYWDEWNYLAPGNAGTFGMGYAAPLWNIIGSPDTRIFDVSMTNYNGWTFADPDYKATTTQSMINLNSLDSNYKKSDFSINITPDPLKSKVFGTTMFKFGKANDTEKTEDYIDINTWDA